MFIVAQNNKTYAKLSFNVGPGGRVLIPVEIDYSREFGPSEHELWYAEYAANVKAVEWFHERSTGDTGAVERDLSGCALPYGFLDEFEKMDPTERRFILDEMAERVRKYVKSQPGLEGLEIIASHVGLELDL